MSDIAVLKSDNIPTKIFKGKAITANHLLSSRAYILQTMHNGTSPTTLISFIIYYCNDMNHIFMQINRLFYCINIV